MKIPHVFVINPKCVRIRLQVIANISFIFYRHLISGASSTVLLSCSMVHAFTVISAYLKCLDRTMLSAP